MSDDAFESTPVQLTRMEGKIDLLNERSADHRLRLDKHDAEISNLQSGVQSLQEGTLASEKATVALALALKEAKETAEANATQGYSPITKLYATAAFVALIVVIYQGATGR